MSPIKYSGLVLGTLFLIAQTPVAVAADDPAVRRIESFYATLTDSMKRGSELGMKGRYQLLAPAIDSTFDIPAMIKFVVGPSWDTMSDADHKALAEAFRRMTIANYASNFDAFHGEKFSVDPSVQTKGTDEFVQSTLTPGSGKPVPLIYRMRNMPAGWKAIDVYLNGYVDELAMRRSDFSATVASGGASALVKKMNDLADSQLGGAKSSTE
jgi:phospholipid transport system substrate-binding protein